MSDHFMLKRQKLYEQYSKGSSTELVGRALGLPKSYQGIGFQGPNGMLPLYQGQSLRPAKPPFIGGKLSKPFSLHIFLW